MSELNNVEQLQVQHYKEVVLLCSERILEAEKHLGELLIKHSDQLVLFEREKT